MNVYFCSDLHFGHRNILKYEPTRLDAIWEMFLRYMYPTKDNFREHVARLFQAKDQTSKDELKSILSLHDKMLINNWNSIVKPEDTVWFLGDLSLCNVEDTKKYFSKLNGHKNLIKGNHDLKSNTFYKDLGFEFVSDYPIILKQKFILSHAPLNYMNNDNNFYYIYGHVHSSKDYETFTDNSVCACVERHNLRPFSLKVFDDCVEDIMLYEPDKER